MLECRPYLNENGWLIGDVDEIIGKYYRRLFYSYFKLKLQRPSRTSHVTIADYQELSSAKIEQEICMGEIQKSPILYFSIYLDSISTNGNAYWYEIASRDIEDFRARLGLRRQPKLKKIHFAIGYTKDGKTSNYS